MAKNIWNTEKYCNFVLESHLQVRRLKVRRLEVSIVNEQVFTSSSS